MWKSEIPPSQRLSFAQYLETGRKLGTPNLARMFLMKCYCMLQNAKVTDFTISESLRENQQGEGGRVKLPPTQIRAKSQSKGFDTLLLTYHVTYR